jgi:hypothetical protein
MNMLIDQGLLMQTSLNSPSHDDDEDERVVLLVV